MSGAGRFTSAAPPHCFGSIQPRAVGTPGDGIYWPILAEGADLFARGCVIYQDRRFAARYGEALSLVVPGQGTPGPRDRPDLLARSRVPNLNRAAAAGRQAL